MNTSTSNGGRYFSRFAEMLNSKDLPIDSEALLTAFPQSKATVAKYLKIFLDENPEYIGRVVGFYPSAATVIRLAESALGPVSGENVGAINQYCKKIVDDITKPIHKRFLSSFLDGHLDVNGHAVHIEKKKLVDFLYDEYVDFVHESDNGLVSIAGGMNEQILMRGLENAGLLWRDDFKKTGTNSEGDLQIEHRGRTTKILYCEIKSYAARERLLRGIRDTPHPEKIGVGFFTNSAEFNPQRTQTLLSAGAMAIYMPDETHDDLHPESLIQTTIQQDRLYRPLSRFFSDMLKFKNTGTLPACR